MEAKIASALLTYGPLGIICLLALYFAWRKDRELTKERKDFQDKLESQSAAHREELKNLQERYITKAETWMAKHSDLVASMTSVLESLERRYSRMKSE